MPSAALLLGSRGHIIQTEAVNRSARVMVVDLQDLPDARAERLRLMVGLTAAETRVAALIAGGLSIRNVAAVLGISPNTVKKITLAAAMTRRAFARKPRLLAC